MTPIAPGQLIGPATPLGAPAPFWFLEAFKVLGFTLHQVPMHLWYAGLPLVALLGVLRGEPAGRLRARLLTAMPVVVAAGINLGVVPLLFTQVAYYRVFYPTGVLMAWPWFSVIVLLTLAYYGVYLGALGIRARWWPRLARGAVWMAALLFPVIGFLFANYFSLMTRVDGWRALAVRTDAAGAVTGLALNTADPTLLPRWLMLFGLALITTAAYVGVDTAFLASREAPDYRRFASRTAAITATVGFAIFAAMGAWYTSAMPARIPTIWMMTAGGLPAVTWIVVLAQRRQAARRWAMIAAVVQAAALAGNAAARQWVQNVELSRYLDVASEPVRVEWNPLILFLVLFVLGLAVVGWMIRRIVEVNRREAAHP